MNKASSFMKVKANTIMINKNSSIHKITDTSKNKKMTSKKYQTNSTITQKINYSPRPSVNRVNEIAKTPTNRKNKNIENKLFRH